MLSLIFKEYHAPKLVVPGPLYAWNRRKVAARLTLSETLAEREFELLAKDEWARVLLLSYPET